MILNGVRYANGQIPAAMLVQVEPGKFLHASFAKRYKAAQGACRAAVGAGFYIASHQDGYRSYASQEAFFRARYVISSTGPVRWDGSRWRKRAGQITSAAPGTSNHGYGDAADITFESAAARTWCRNNFRAYGITDEGDAFGEDWHKGYVGPMDTTTTAGNTGTPIGDDSMSAADVADLKQWMIIAFAQVRDQLTAAEMNLAGITREADVKLYRNISTGEEAAINVAERYARVFTSVLEVESYVRLGVVSEAPAQQVNDDEYRALLALARSPR